MPTAASKTRIDRNPDGTLDDAVFDGRIHIEQMDEGHWWVGITTHEGALYHINLYSKRPIAAYIEVDHDGHVQRQAKARKQGKGGGGAEGTE